MKDHYTRLAAAQTIVLKLGTRLLTHPTGEINPGYIEKIVSKLVPIREQGRNLVIVSSGAVGAGMGRLGLNRRPATIPERQAAAAVGQGLLIQSYEKIFAGYGHAVAQILLTRSDLVSRRRYINARNTISTLLKWGVIPIINENDSVSVEEIKFGDNDRLSALVAGLIDADLLILCTDIDGFYNANPREVPGATLIPVVEKITPEIRKCAGDSNSGLATGGMITKLQAAEIAVHSGADMVITSGSDLDNINRILNGEPVGTLFTARDYALKPRKRWIAYGQVARGTLIVDQGAGQALIQKNKSLLAIGIVRVEGLFKRGDLVLIADTGGREIGRGLVNFSSDDLSRIIKLPSARFSEVLGRECEAEVVHRDNLVVKD